jgi:galactose mutarotase-like enzyme
MDFPTPRERVLTMGTTTVGVIPELSLVSQFQVGPWQVLYRPMETGNVRRWGIPLMIPNFSRLENGIFQEKGTTLPIHGFGRVLPWTVVSQEQARITIQLMSDDATRQNYPYDFTFTAAITAGNQTLTYTLTMENRSDENMPIAPGFHPYFAIAQDQKANLKVHQLADFDPATVQWDVKPPDTPYTFPHSVTVEFPQQGTLTIEEQPIDGQYKLKTMQIWSEPASAVDSAFVCFEPVVTSENGLNRPADRLNIAPHTSQQLTLQLTANPL